MNDKITELCELAYKYGADKCSQIKHNYTPFYYELLKNKRFLIKKVLEMGIGYSTIMNHVTKIKGYYQRGASLYMWREFFPNAQIFGADIRPETIFEDERIKTYLYDERKKEDIERLIDLTGSDIDLFIDDASHDINDQIFACQILMPLLNKDVIYIIEDVKFPDLMVNRLHDYDIEVPNFVRRYRDDRLVLVKNK